MAREPAAGSGKKCLKSGQPRAMARTMARVRARAIARATASARGRARTSLELGLGLIRVSCIIKTWFKQNSAVMCRCPSGSCTGPSKEWAWVLIWTIFCCCCFSGNFLSSTSIVPGQSSTSCRFCSIILPVPAPGSLGIFFRNRLPAL